MDTEKLRHIIKETVDATMEHRCDRPCELSEYDLSSLSGIPMNTLKTYLKRGGLPRLEKHGIEVIDVASFRDWCMENMRGDKKSRTVGKLDSYISQFRG